jgi:hypothetical protein
VVLFLWAVGSLSFGFTSVLSPLVCVTVGSFRIKIPPSFLSYKDFI